MKFSNFHQNKGTSDEELAKQYREDGDLAILGELYNRYLGMTMGLCMKFFKHVADSEDATMEIFEVVAKRLPNHEVENFKSWLYRVASNHCLDILRKRKRVNEKEIEALRVHSQEQVRPIDEHFGELDEKEILLQAMDDCIEELGEKQKACVKMFYLEKKNYEEVSSSLEISWSQTRSFIQNGRRNLKKCMEKKHESAS